MTVQPDHQRDSAPDDGNERHVQSGQARRLHQHCRRTDTGCHDSPWWWEERHPTTTEETVYSLQLYSAVQHIH